MTNLYSYSKIADLKSVFKNLVLRFRYAGHDESGNAIYDNTKTLPVVQFSQTVKIHGTNASVVFYRNGEHQIQSRSRIITVDSDNQGFAVFAEQRLDVFKRIADRALAQYPDADFAVVYGEFAGQNIQKGVAVSQLPKQFYAFEIRVGKDNGPEVEPDYLVVDHFLNDHELFDTTANEKQIYSIMQFDNKIVDIDLNKTHQHYIEQLLKDVEQVEKECPVAKHFGVSGIGEGIVLKYSGDGNKTFRIKVKGDKHTTSKIKSLTSNISPEDLKKLDVFVDSVITENRVKQAIDFLVEQNLPLDKSSTGAAMRWIVNDVHTEEKDEIAETGLDVKKLNSAMSNKARRIFFKLLDEME